MARMTFMAGEDYMLKLSYISAHSSDIAEKALAAASGIVADKIRSNLEQLPEDTFRFLEEGEKFNVLSKSQKWDLLNSLGITPMNVDRNGDYNVKVGFDGYGSFPTKAYPKGLPNQLLARAIESGSPVRLKKPFVRTAVNSVKKQAINIMNQTIIEELKKIGL